MSKDDDVVYNGQRISRKYFRTFIYGINGEKKLVCSWSEYKNHMSLGTWFDSIEDALSNFPKKELQDHDHAKNNKHKGKK